MENANIDLEVKLEDKKVIPTRSITEAPLPASDITSILLQMSKQQERQDKQWAEMQKQQGEIQKQIGKQFTDFQKEMADKFSNALKVSGKPKFKRIEPTFSPKRDIDNPSLYRRFKIDFDHFIADVDPANWADKTRWIKQCVKEDAYQLIKEVTLDEVGYKEAFQKLEAKYLNTDEIQDNILHFIHTISVPNTGKNHSTLSSKLVTLKKLY